MNTFLEQPEATFYHITTKESWEKIKTNGLKPPKGRLFVSRSGEPPILFAIATEQLPEIYKTEAVVFLKLPQLKNNFSPEEIIPDNQAGVEWTKPYQNIISRPYIPIEDIEVMMIIELGGREKRTFILDCMTKMANEGQVYYMDHIITLRAKQLKNLGR